jgi:hypothetical protein
MRSKGVGSFSLAFCLFPLHTQLVVLIGSWHYYKHNNQFTHTPPTAHCTLHTSTVLLPLLLPSRRRLGFPRGHRRLLVGPQGGKGILSNPITTVRAQPTVGPHEEA